MLPACQIHGIECLLSLARALANSPIQGLIILQDQVPVLLQKLFPTVQGQIIVSQHEHPPPKQQLIQGSILLQIDHGLPLPPMTPGQTMTIVSEQKLPLQSLQQLMQGSILVLEIKS
jgi:hypothetical protein